MVSDAENESRVIGQREPSEIRAGGDNVRGRASNSACRACERLSGRSDI